LIHLCIPQNLLSTIFPFVRNTDKRLHQLQETTIIQINNDIDILNKKCSTLDSKVNEVSSEVKGEMSVHMIDLKNKLESMEESVDTKKRNKRTN
jgi:peptidoglycan hydrolase CwlO-like protein